MTLVAMGDCDDYAMYAELRGNAAELDFVPRWRFGPASRGGNLLKTRLTTDAGPAFQKENG
jgi:hypothetical protein